MEEVLNKIIDWCMTYSVRLLIAAAVLIIGFRLVKFFVGRLRKGKLTEKLDHTVASFLLNALAIGLKLLLAVTAVGILGIPMSSVVALLAAAGAAIGLALQGALSNLAGGIMLLLFKPFRLDDYVEVNGVSGTVVSITIIYTVLRTPDNKDVSLPNGAVMNNTIVNYSANDLRRVDLNFNVSYDSDIDRVREVLSTVASSHPLVCKDPATEVYLQEQGDSAMVFVLRAWCKKEDYWTIFFDLKETAKKAFDKVGIDIPFPQMDVHVTKQS